MEIAVMHRAILKTATRAIVVTAASLLFTSGANAWTNPVSYASNAVTVGTCELLVDNAVTPDAGISIHDGTGTTFYLWIQATSTAQETWNPWNAIGLATDCGLTNVALVTSSFGPGTNYSDTEDMEVEFTGTENGVNYTWKATISGSGIPVLSVSKIAADGNAGDQQSFFVPLIMNHQSYNMISGVGDNLSSLFNGNGLAPLVSESGFSFQSAGATKWYAKRLKMAEAKKQPAALDILANHSRTSQTRNTATRGDIPVNLTAYQSTNDNASIKTVKKLDAVAKDDIYAADVSPTDEQMIYSPWNVWVKGSWSIYEAHDSASFDGHMIDVVGGVDYRLSDDLIVGVLGGYGMADFDTMTAGTAGSFDSDGVHAGVYLGKRLAPNLLFDALLAYTSSDYDTHLGATTGSFGAHRITVAAHLKGNIDWGMVTIQPAIGLMYASERQDAYTDTAAVVHAAKTVTAGRLSIGPKFIFQPVTREFGTTQFWFAAKGEYDFSNQNTSATSSLPDISDVASARVQAGLSIVTDSGISLSLQGDVSGLGSGEFIGYGVSGKLSLPF